VSGPERRGPDRPDPDRLNPERRGPERRERLARARLMLLFTPEVVRPGAEPLALLELLLPWIDVVQVRVKEPGQALAPARATLELTRAVRRRLDACGSPALLIVNDRVDVAGLLADEVDGVHLGADDAPVELARRLLGPDALIGLSTHSPAEAARAQGLEVDYLGFGPIHPTRTKGYAHGLGVEAAWIASRAGPLPLFPIGGIEPSNAGELTEIGRAAVSAALLAAADPAGAAAALRAQLEEPDAGPLPGQGSRSSASP